MRARNKTSIAIIGGLATIGAVAAVSLPANAADKGAPSSAISARKVMTGAANASGHTARPQLSSGVGVERRTGDTCSAYSDGHGDFCMWYFSNFSGSVTGFLRDDANLFDDTFVSAGSGQGSRVTNNAESDWNYDRFGTVYVATSPNYTGSIGFVGPSSGGNFSATYKNNVESLYWAG